MDLQKLKPCNIRMCLLLIVQNNPQIILKMNEKKTKFVFFAQADSFHFTSGVYLLSGDKCEVKLPPCHSILPFKPPIDHLI